MIIFKCSTKEVLKQDAVLTFVLLKSGRELDREKRAEMLLDLADVAFIPSQKPQYQTDLKKNYRKRLGYQERPATQVNLTDPNLGSILSKALGGPRG